MPFPDQGLLKTIEAKTAAYQIIEGDCGTIFTNRGASGSVTFTLPAVTSPALPSGWWCGFFVVADQNLVIASQGSNDNIVAKNDAAADSLTFSTVGELIGSSIAMIVWDGTSWLPFYSTEELVTVTAA